MGDLIILPFLLVWHFIKIAIKVFIFPDDADRTRERINPAIDTGLTVVMVDMQEYFLSDLSKERVAKLIRHQKKVLEYCLKHDIPVVVLEYAYCGSTIPELRKLVKKLRRKRFFLKQCDDGFESVIGSLHDILQEWQTGKLIFMGVNATVCVRQTAESAKDKGYQVLTSPRLVEDSERGKGSSMKWYVRNGIVKGCEEKLLAEAGVFS